jgi:hypothetical protein
VYPGGCRRDCYQTTVKIDELHSLLQAVAAVAAGKHRMAGDYNQLQAALRMPRIGRWGIAVGLPFEISVSSNRTFGTITFKL